MDPIYIYSRGVGLFLAICGLIVTTVQLYLLHQRKVKVVETKYYTHYCCFSSLFFNIFNFIDPDGVFTILPIIFLGIVVTLSGSSIGIGFCLLVYNHFQAHYLAIKKNRPGWLRIILFFIMNLSIVGNLLSVILVYGLNLEIYSCIAHINALLWIFIVVSADLYCYYLVRKLVFIGLETEKKILRSQKDNLPSEESTSTNEYNDLLKRMRNFHIIIFFLGVVFVLIQFTALLNAIKSGNSPPIHPNPNSFVSYYTATNVLNGFLHLFLTEIFTWWAWIPVSKQEISNDNEKTYLSKSDHKPCMQMENRSPSPLKMLSLELSLTNESLSPLKMLSLELSSTGQLPPATEILTQTVDPDQDISVS